MAGRRLAPEPCSWPLDLPWEGIKTARLTFEPEVLLASGEAQAIALPEALHSAVAKRRADYIAGRLCARVALRRLAGLDQTVGRATDGAPCWPEGVTGSISHAGGEAVAVAASTRRYRSLGVDVEPLMTRQQAETLMPMILTAEEREGFIDRSPAMLATLVFSLKEALFKALHPLTGTMFFHEDAELVALEPGGWARLRLLTPLSLEWRAGATLSGFWHCVDDRIFCLICVESH
jgi:enterobactin synthetase component D